MSARPASVILFDGVCNLCCFWVQFLIRRDPEKRFRFSTLQSPIGQETLKRLGLAPPPDLCAEGTPAHCADPTKGWMKSGGGVDPQVLTTMILVEGDRYDTKSSAALHIARRMSGLWPLLVVFTIVPAPIRDFFYALVAKNRYRWFGKRSSCMVPTPDLKERFL